jgi:hypothetical protein
MKNFNLLLLLMLLHTVNTKSQTSISPNLIGQNYWMPAHNNYDGNNTNLTGELQNHWTDIRISGVKFIRVGGIQYNDLPFDDPTILTVIDDIRNPAKGNAEPIIQIPFNNGWTLQDNIDRAVAIFNHINTNNNKNIMYWSIGNEPNAEYLNWNTSIAIASYIKAISTALKGINPNIKIMGPELTHYISSLMNDFTEPDPNNNHSTSLMGQGSNGYYIDFISFHTYPRSA